MHVMVRLRDADLYALTDSGSNHTFLSQDAATVPGADTAAGLLAAVGCTHGPRPKASFWAALLFFLVGRHRQQPKLHHVSPELHRYRCCHPSRHATDREGGGGRWKSSSRLPMEKVLGFELHRYQPRASSPPLPSSISSLRQERGRREMEWEGAKKWMGSPNIGSGLLRRGDDAGPKAVLLPGFADVAAVSMGPMRPHMSAAGNRWGEKWWLTTASWPCAREERLSSAKSAEKRNRKGSWHIVPSGHIVVMCQPHHRDWREDLQECPCVHMKRMSDAESRERCTMVGDR
uniref:Uncharacterized protein n=1 Tax=Oryza punctata TaxID=4537 RepID=A0A0E0JJC4_ORYPU